jgi:hypothetical protein
MSGKTDLLDSKIERRFVDLGWSVEAAELAHELQGGCTDLIILGWRLEVEQRFDVSAHIKDPLSRHFPAKRIIPGRGRSCSGETLLILKGKSTGCSEVSGKAAAAR